MLKIDITRIHTHTYIYYNVEKKKQDHLLGE